MKAVISNIQRFSMHDGPGIRTTVFFKGCPLRCLWCHNPETYRFGTELRYKKSACIGCRSCIAACETRALSAGENGLVHDSAICRSCMSCADACPAAALAVSGSEMTLDRLMEEALRDKGAYERSGGGVTLSGGEASAQYDIALAFLSALKENGIHTALDTCGFCPPDRFEKLVRAADLVLFDIKHADSKKHKELTGVPNELILQNLDACENYGTDIEIRIPVIPGLNDSPDELAAVAKLLRGRKAVKRAILLGYHPLGLSKIYDFDRTGKDLGITAPKKDRMQQLACDMETLSGIETIYR